MWGHKLSFGGGRQFFHYPKPYLSWNLIREKKIVHKLKKFFSWAVWSQWMRSYNPSQSQWLYHMHPLLKGYCCWFDAETSQISGSEIIVLVYRWMWDSNVVSILQTYRAHAHVFNHYANSLFPSLGTCVPQLIHKHLKIYKMPLVLSPILLHS